MKGRRHSFNVQDRVMYRAKDQRRLTALAAAMVEASLNTGAEDRPSKEPGESTTAYVQSASVDAMDRQPGAENRAQAAASMRRMAPR